MDIVSVHVPDAVEWIAEYVFEDCKKLEEISLPNASICFPLSAVAGCSNLEKIEFRGKMAEWELIVDYYVYPGQLIPEFAVHCIEGDIIVD
jgi:hypothetical protein